MRHEDTALLAAALAAVKRAEIDAARREAVLAEALADMRRLRAELCANEPETIH